MATRILRVQEVLNRTGLKRSMIYQLVKQGEFPRQVTITGRIVGWMEDEVEGWIMEKREQRA